MATGRKKDLIWESFEQKEIPGKMGFRAECKKCKKEMAGLVARMKAHFNSCILGAGSCSQEDDPPKLEKIVDVTTNTELGKRQATNPYINANKRHASTASLSNFIVKTSKHDKECFDIQVARFIYATNSTFSCVDHPEFRKMFSNIRPGYKPPNRHEVGGILLDKVHESVMKTYENDLRGQTVCAALDGWSNIHNEPIVGITVSCKGQIYLVNTIDTSGHPHEFNYLCEIASVAINAAEKRYGCLVGSFVTDNAANVVKMRNDLKKSEGNKVNIITYGCSAHILNLLAKDIKISNVKAQVVDIVKYFRNNHFASAKLRETGAKKLELPSDIRWNSMVDTMESYLSNWPLILKVCEENREKINSDISKKVIDFQLKRNVEDYLQRLKPIAVACDKAQRSNCTISDIVEVWKNLKKEMSEICAASNLTKIEGKRIEKAIEDRYEMAMTPAHFLANITDPRFKGESLTIEETEKGMKLGAELCPGLVPIIINYKAKSAPFSNYMFDAIDNMMKKEKDVLLSVTNDEHCAQESKVDSFVDITPLSWWKSLTKHIDKNVMQNVIQLHTAVCSTAGLERVFSTFGFVQSKTRNRLGVDKAAKLVTIFKALNN